MKKGCSLLTYPVATKGSAARKGTGIQPCKELLGKISLNSSTTHCDWRWRWRWRYESRWRRESPTRRFDVTSINLDYGRIRQRSSLYGRGRAIGDGALECDLRDVAVLS